MSVFGPSGPSDIFKNLQGLAPPNAADIQNSINLKNARTSGAKEREAVRFELSLENNHYGQYLKLVSPLFPDAVTGIRSLNSEVSNNFPGEMLSKCAAGMFKIPQSAVSAAMVPNQVNHKLKLVYNLTLPNQNPIA